jgi:hypothetical protein
MKIQNIAPCNDPWYYKTTPPGEKEQVYKVALWALTDTGEVVGMMVPLLTGAQAPKTKRLQMQPRGDGGYVLEDELNVRPRAVAGMR